MSELFRICVPTYKREKPLCLQLLEKDESIVLHLYVRKAEYESGFYDGIKQKRIVFHLISDNTVDIGDTRKQVLESCIEDKVKYCVMLDDSVTDIFIFDEKDRPTSVINYAIELMKYDELHDYVADFAFAKYGSIDNDGSLVVLDRSFIDEKRYFTTFPCQCHIIDVNKIKAAGITYHAVADCGFEDANFLGDIIKAGLVVIGRKYICFNAAYANKLKTGGTHTVMSTDLKALERKYDKFNKMSLDYLKLDGTSIEKRYRKYVGCNLSLIKWDYDFYREVLVEKREQNKDIIANHLSTYN